MAIQGGVTAVVATCGTALTQPQAQLLRRFAANVVLSFDPDAAGQGAAVRSCDLLVREGFEVNVALLPPGATPTWWSARKAARPTRRCVDARSRTSTSWSIGRRRSTTPRRRPAGSRS